MDASDVTRVQREISARIRDEAFGRWEGIWNESGIAMACHADAGSADGACPRTAPGHVLRSMDAGRLAVGDLVSVRDAELPNANNQHLRKVISVEPTAGRPGRVDVTLGASKPRIAWPFPIRHATAPTTLHVDTDGEAVRITEDSGFSVAFKVEPDNAGIWAGYVHSMITSAAELGRAPRDGEGEHRFAIVQGNGNGSRTWDIVDEAGKVYARDTRGLMDRRPPGRLDALRRIADCAYEEGSRERVNPDPEALVMNVIDLGEPMRAPGR
jgi:hypothetical protein